MGPCGPVAKEELDLKELSARVFCGRLSLLCCLLIRAAV